MKTLLLRSGLGFHLRQRECITGASRCDGCTSKSNCWYSLIFDTPGELVPQGRGRDRAVSHPFYFCSAPALGNVPGGTRLPCLLTVFGSPDPVVRKVVGALQDAGASGRWGAKFGVDAVVSAIQPGLFRSGWEVAASVEWPCWQFGSAQQTSAIRVQFLSPLRLRIRGVVQRRPTFGEFARALLRRIHLLASLYSQAELDRGWAGPLLASAQIARTIGQEWRYVREARFSGRQQQELVMDGVWGGMEVVGDLSALWSFLEVGQWLGVGASTAHGFGCYTVERI